MMFSVLIAKLVSKLLRIMGRGATTLPGKIALRLKYNILNCLSRNVGIICVTGTNGKTTTCALIEAGLKAAGKSYFINKSGANMITGIATAFIDNATVFGRCKKDYAVLECDENSFPAISRYIDANIIVVTNVFRDQLDRYGEVSHTLGKISMALDNNKQAMLVLNADCPLTMSLVLKRPNRLRSFGINADFNIKSKSDSRFCPVCNYPLNYRSRVYAQLGDYCCPCCGFSRKQPNVYADSIISVNDAGSAFMLNVGDIQNLCSLSIGGIYNVYNFLSAVAVLDAIGVGDYSVLREFSGAFGRTERFSYNGKSITLMLVKNPVGLSQCIECASEIKERFNFAFSLNDKYADSRDVSWVWDADFKPIRDKYINVYTLGTRSYDIAVRLKYDGIKTDKMIFGENYRELIDIIKSQPGDFVIFATYTSMMAMRHRLIEEFGGREFWQ